MSGVDKHPKKKEEEPNMNAMRHNWNRTFPLDLVIPKDMQDILDKMK